MNGMVDYKEIVFSTLLSRLTIFFKSSSMGGSKKKEALPDSLEEKGKGWHPVSSLHPASPSPTYVPHLSVELDANSRPGEDG